MVIGDGMPWNLRDARWLDRMLRVGGPAGDESDTGNDAEDAEPARGRDLLMQPEAGQERDDDIGEGGGGKHEGDISPRERSQVGGEESDKENDAGENPGQFQRDNAAC